MLKYNQQKFFKMIKGKIIIAFLLAFLALITAWLVSKFVFDKMLTKVEEISAPNDKLRIVNDLSNKVSLLDQQQRNQAINQSKNYKQFFKSSRSIKLGLDTLALLYQDDSAQLKRIRSIKNLLAERDHQFLKYLKVRESLVNNKSFSKEVAKLNELVNTKVWKADSTVYTTEAKTSTKTFLPDKESKKGFLSRLFSKKDDEGYKMVSEELKIKKDSLNAFAEDSILSDMENSLKSIEIEHRLKSNRFLKQEANLSEANNDLTLKMLSILEKVKNEVVAQMNYNGFTAKKVVNKGILQITAILIVFLVITILLLYFILSDITKSNKYRTELELAKEEAEYHGKAKQRFLSNMSHEIRTPLQSIIGYSEQISLQSNPAKKDIEAIKNSSNHLLQIVNEVLDYNRIISGEFNIKPALFDIDKLIKESVEVLQNLSYKKSITIDTDIQIPENFQVIGDAFRLKQILFNLIGNAIKFTNQNGRIDLIVKYKSQNNDIHFYFTVKDNGIGISKDNLNKIFDEFHQIAPDNKQINNQNGTGLGLSIVKKLVENQQGSINVKSKLNVGSTFMVYLKYQKADQNLDQTKGNKTLSLKKGKAVWVIDDDQLILDLCAMIFKNHQINHRCFTKPQEVLNEKADLSVKYILIDMRLPQLSGTELFKILKPKFSNDVRFYAITAQVLPDEREDILKNGFDGLIMKPFRTEDLLKIFEHEPQIETKPTPIEINLDQLKKMTFGDKAQLNKVLKSFIENCKGDELLLQEALSNANKPATRLIIHRLAGRISQMGSKKLAADYRKFELEIEYSDKINLAHHQKTKILIGQLQLLMQTLENKDHSMP
ncbi:response regulator [Pedobacter sp. SD-b]|uniref:histidine kinase n=1 Tax=Pedobacter segetis TaxID=2793069 RepID=A0ABS1BLW2_9SPHI|nr:ATP-binding protein [Pedobacter segetis]MBK0383883.1 response regulator [Pedobacter segetis]